MYFNVFLGVSLPPRSTVRLSRGTARGTANLRGTANTLTQRYGISFLKFSRSEATSGRSFLLRFILHYNCMYIYYVPIGPPVNTTVPLIIKRPHSTEFCVRRCATTSPAWTASRRGSTWPTPSPRRFASTNR